ncbi:PH domain-containing protein [Pseudonocardia sp. KRD-291]|nr:PH domain-containing protein [Pseudonocardia sp. KRD291]
MWCECTRQVHAAYQLIRDAFLFTDRRLILVDRQGITGRKVEYRYRH